MKDSFGERWQRTHPIPELSAGTARLLAVGEFDRFRDFVGARGEENEAARFIKKLQDAHDEFGNANKDVYPTPEKTDPMALRFFTSTDRSADYYRGLFEIARAAHFTDDDRAAMGAFVDDIGAAALERYERSSTTLSGQGAHEQQQAVDDALRERSNARAALDAIFPEQAPHEE